MLKAFKTQDPNGNGEWPDEVPLNPMVAIKWLDYVWASPQGYLYSNYEIEGDTYNIVPGEKSESPWLSGFPGRPEYSDSIRNNPDGKSVQSVLSDMGAFNHPVYADDDESFCGTVLGRSVLVRADPARRSHRGDAVPALPRHAGAGTAPGALREEINPTQEEWTFKFITGTGDARPV